jgi:hypothetical protein
MIPMRYDVHMDFRRDWTNYQKMQLQNLGYTENEGWDDFQISYNYFNWLRRVVMPYKRNIHFSQEFQCPQEHRNGLLQLQKKLEVGEPTWPNLSRRLRDLNYNDDLMNDWAIHHFHLGTVREKDGFMKRTGPVLFTKITDSDAYFLNVFDHHSFSKVELIRILHRNWPDLIRDFRVATDITPEVNDNDVAEFRKLGLTTFVQVVPGVAYMPLGYGLTSARTSLEVGTTVDYYDRLMGEFETYVRQKSTTWVNEARNQGFELGPRLNFHLRIQEGENGPEAFAAEINSGTLFKLWDFSENKRRQRHGASKSVR